MVKESDKRVNPKIVKKNPLARPPIKNSDSKIKPGLQNYQKKREEKIKNPTKKEAPALPPQDVKYKKADKITWETIKENIPEPLIPTKLTAYALGSIILLVILINFTVFFIDILAGMSKFSSTNVEEAPVATIKMTLGWPMDFFYLDFDDPTAMPLKFGGLLVDLLLYLILAYLIEVAIKYFRSTDFVQRLLGYGDYVDAKPRVMTPKRV